jgi:hypothetical protein
MKDVLNFLYDFVGEVVVARTGHVGLGAERGFAIEELNFLFDVHYSIDIYN